VGGTFFCQRFNGFGPTHLNPATAAPPLHHVQARTTPTLRKRVRLFCPRRPGVYGMLDANGELIYVGKAKVLRTRLLSYFSSRSRVPKAGHILQQTRTIVWEHAPSEFAALLRELELIRRWRPPLNVQGQPHRRGRTYVCLGRRPAPYAFLTKRPPSDVVACFGPVLAGHKAHEAVRRLNDWFKLRDCPQAQQMHFADQGELFPILRAAGCIRYEIDTCLGPCAGACTRLAYEEQLRAASAFLAGKNHTPLEALEAEMIAAGAALAFERAAAVRDKLDVFRWLRRQLDVLQAARERHTFIYPVRGHAQATLWYLIHQGRVRAVLTAPADVQSRRKTAELIERIYRLPSPTRSGPVEDVDTVLLVAGWFRRHPEEKVRTLPPAQALEMCQARRADVSTLKVAHYHPGHQIGRQHCQTSDAHCLAREIPQQERHHEQLDTEEDA
jgi:excinuclease ABC subunit C